MAARSFLTRSGHLPIELRAKLLGFMDENGEYEPLGDATRYADMHIFAATNRDVSELKHDLLERLDLHIELPSFDTHPEDVPLLATFSSAHSGQRDHSDRFNVITPIGTT
jgi:DNA-binding NtrC family response regulator